MSLSIFQFIHPIRIVILLCCCFAFSIHSIKANNSDYVLCINSYTDASPWSNQIITTISKHIQSEPNVKLSVEHMEMMLLDNHYNFSCYKDELLDKYADKRPIALVLIGSSAFSLRDDFREKWGDIPIILYTSFDYTAEQFYYINDKYIPKEKRIYIKDIKDEYNVVLFISNLFIEENINYINQRVPELKKLILLRDHRQVNCDIKRNVEATLKNNYPHVELSVLTPNICDINDLVDSLNNIDTRNTAILFVSWSHVSELGNSRAIVGNTNLLIGTADVPLFTLNFADITTYNGVMHSSVTYDFEDMRVKILSAFKAIINGTQARHIQDYTPTICAPYLRYDVAEAKGIDISNIPSNTILINTPISIFERYRYYILSLFFIVGLGLILILFRSRELNIQKKAAIKDRENATKLMNKADESNRLKSTFLANMSHEIRTPLNAIVGFSTLLSETEDENEKKEFAHIISSNSDILLRLINDILDLSKLEAGMVQIHPSQFDVVALLDESYKNWWHQAASKHIEFDTHLPYPSCYVELDKNIIVHVINNYMSNAIKYTPSGKITLGATPKKDGIKIYVKDTGIGIPQDKQTRTFGRFEKLDEFAQGTGLGLSICKAMTELCNGKVGFESQEGIGSTFWAWFPCTVSIDTPQEQVIPTQQPTNNTIIQKRKQNILIAEDNTSNYKLIEILLKDNYHLKWVNNGQEAVNAIHKQAYDLILMDIQMPVMDGLTATREIRSFNKQIKIIVLTANAFESDKQASLDAGADAFIPKPIDKKALIKTINTLTC